MLKHNVTASEIKEFRKGVSLTQNELAQRLYINWATVNRLEKGHNKMSSLVYRNFMEFCKKNDSKLYKKLKARNGG